ncbi:MAG: hypothetical protein ACE14P_04060 [Methanotrichaceae archaeon]
MTLVVTVNRLNASGKPDAEPLNGGPVPDMITAVELISKMHYPGLSFIMKHIDSDNVDMLITKPSGEVETCRITVLKRY